MTRFLLTLVACSALACGSHLHYSAGFQVPSGPPATESELQVGTARADLTPPPGVSAFGHAPDARVSDGYWTRLECRVFVIATPRSKLVMVPCDLPALGFALQRSVATLVSDVVPASRLMMTATHTHAGPAHYLESVAYGGATSTRDPGLDDNMLTLLSTRIAAAIHAASGELRPAELRWSHDVKWGLTHNRALDAYRLNREIPPFAPPSDLPDAEKAVDPSFNVIEFRPPGEEHQRIGEIVFFAIHPTVLPANNRYLGADIFGVTSRALESRMRRDLPASCQDKEAYATGCDPLAAIVNTNEGDISPIWSRGTEEEAIEVGGRLADAATAVVDHKGGWRPRAVVDARWLEVDMPGAEIAKGDAICMTADLGEAGGRGATDHPSSLNGLIEDPSELDPRPGCMTPKRMALGGLQPVLAGKRGFPMRLAFGIARLDDTLVGFVPGELTFTEGYRVRQAMLRHAAKGTFAVLGGLANSYIQYVTTEEEYRLQQYEGGSDVYGPKTGRLFESRLEALSVALAGGNPDRVLGSYTIDEVPAADVPIATREHRLPMPDDGRPPKKRKFEGLCALPRSRDVCGWWYGPGPGRVKISDEQGSPWIVLAHPGERQAVRLTGHGCKRPAVDPSAAVDDRGSDFSVRARFRSVDRASYVWSFVFRPTQAETDELASCGQLSFRTVETHPADDIVSPVFDDKNLVPECSVEAVQFCLTESMPP